MIAHNKKLGLALGLAGVCLFAGTLPATRLAVATINPLFLTAARAALAGCAGVILLLVLRRPLPPRAEWGTIVLGGFCTIVGFPVFTALAMVSVPAAHGGVVLGIMPLATRARQPSLRANARAQASGSPALPVRRLSSPSC